MRVQTLHHLCEANKSQKDFEIVIALHDYSPMRRGTHRSHAVTHRAHPFPFLSRMIFALIPMWVAFTRLDPVGLLGGDLSSIVVSVI